MEKFIRNEWNWDPSGAFEVASILQSEVHPEGLDLFRVRFAREGELHLNASVGHILSPLAGEATFELDGRTIQIRAGVHLYLPRGVRLSASEGFRGVVVSAGAPEQSAGPLPLLRDEEFIKCCAEERPFRWILTPQYLSRRVFLHHDRTLLSKSGHPISWFRTTMFDVAGLPENEEGKPVFKMSYNYRTEPNVLVDVQGDLKVRVARHPYAEAGQLWDDWQSLSAEHTYHLNEAADGGEIEWREEGGKRRAFRNKHEVSMTGGHATLFCVFDPAPTGKESHRTGAYSDYGPLADVLGTPEYEAHLGKMRPFDEMIDALSLQKAGGASALEASHVEALRELSDRGRAAQTRYEERLLQELQSERPERAELVRAWSVVSQD